MGEETIVSRLKWITEEYLRNKKGALAEAMKCSPGYISDLFSGKKANPSSELLANLLSYLAAQGVNIRQPWLINGTGEKFSQDRKRITYGDTIQHLDLYNETVVVGLKEHAETHCTATDQALEWVISSMTEEEVDAAVQAAMTEKRRDVAHKLLEIANRVASSKADGVAAEALRQGVAGAKRPHVKYGHSPSVAAPTGKTSAPDKPAGSESDPLP